MFQVAAVPAWDASKGAAVNDHDRRVRTPLVRIAELGPHHPGSRRLLAGDGFLQRPCEARGGELDHRRCVRAIDRLEHPADAPALESRDRVQFCETEEPELAVEFAFEARMGLGR